MAINDLLAPRLIGGNKASYPADDTSGATYRYIDFTATHNGDGTTAAQASTNGGVGARNQLAISDYSAGTTWAIWIRRVGSQTISSNFTFNQANMFFIGWPMNADPNYHARPASGISNNWDDDTNTYAVLTCSSATIGITVSTNTGQRFRRLQFINTSADTGSGHTWTMINITCELTHCDISFVQGSGGTSTSALVKSSTGTASDCSPTLTDVSFETTRGGLALQSEFNCASFIGCVIQNTSNTANGTVCHVKNGLQTLFQDCIFTVTSGTSVQKLMLLDSTSSQSQVVFLGCRFDVGSGGQGTTLDLQTACAIISCTFRGYKINATGFGSTPGIEWNIGTYPLHFTDMHFLAWSFVTQITGDVPIYLVANNIKFDTDNSQPIICTSSRYIVNNLRFVGSHDWQTFIEGFSGDRQGAFLETPGMYSYDNVGIAGKFRKLSDQGEVDFSSLPGAVLTGLSPAGGNMAIGLGSNAYGPATRYMPTESNDPDDDTHLVFLTAGTRTLTIYGTAASLFGLDIFMHIDYLDQGSGAHRATASSYVDSYQQASFDGLWHTLATLVISVGQDCWAQIRFSGPMYLDATAVIS